MLVPRLFLQALTLSPTNVPKKIKALQEQARVCQAVFAAVLNTSRS